jgi:hypothetical protein
MILYNLQNATAFHVFRFSCTYHVSSPEEPLAE